MATGSGKTFTAISFYRLLKFAKAKRVPFLVDTKTGIRWLAARNMEQVEGLVGRCFASCREAGKAGKNSRSS